MNSTRLSYTRFLKVAAVVAIIAGSTLGVGGQRHRATLSSDLLSFEGRRTAAAASNVETIKEVGFFDMSRTTWVG